MAEAEQTSRGASRTGWQWRNLGRNLRPPGLRATIIATLLIAGLTPLAIVLALHLLVVEPRLLGWTTVVHEDAAVAFAPVMVIRRIVVGTLVLTALGMLAFGLWCGQRLSGPILALAERMRRLAAGDTASSMGPTGQGDDIGQMAQAVEVFRQALIEKDLSSARRSLAMEAADIGSWDFDVGTGEMIGDARCEAIFATPPGSFMDYAGFLALLHPLDRDRLDTLVQKALDPMGGGLFQAEYRIIGLTDGVERWVSARGRGIVEAGVTTRLIGTAVDVTERKRVEAVLGESEARRVLAMELAQIGSWESDVTDRSFSGDARSMTLFGYPDETRIPYEAWSAALHPEDRQAVTDAVAASLDPAGPRGFDVEHRVIDPRDGRESWIAATGRVLFEDDRPVQMIGTMVDVTERRRAEAKLRESEERRLMAMDAADIWPWEFNPRTRMLSIPPGAGPGAAPPGLPADVVVHYDVWEQLVHPDDRDRIADRMAAALDPSASGLYNTEYRVMRPDLGERWVSGMGKAHFADGEAVRLIGTAMDITDRKRAEAQAHEREQLLRDVQAELAHANRVATTGHLAGSIAHDVNQPLHAAMASAAAAVRWLSADPPDIEEAKLALAVIAKSCRRAGEIVDGMRALVKKDAARIGPVALNGAVAEIVALTRNEAERNGVEVRTQLAEDLPPIEGDRVQLQQVILNLVINAVQAMSGLDGPRDLLITTAATKDGVVAAVEDTGPGFSAEQANQLFDAFYTTKASGLGLGLSICRSIADAHGGRLSAMAKTPRGARFEFSLPTAPTADP